MTDPLLQGEWIMRVLRNLLPACVSVFVVAAVLVMDVVPGGWGTATVRASSTDSPGASLSLKQAVTDIVQSKHVSGGIRVAIRADKTSAAPGEPVTFSVNADKDCHLVLMHLGKQDHVNILWPNRASNWDDRVRAGEAVTVPASGQRIKLEFDGKSPEELVIAVASDERGLVLGNRDLAGLTGDELKVIRGDPRELLEEIARRIKSLGPQVQWGAAELAVRVGSSAASSGDQPSSRQVKVTLHIYSGRPDPTWTLAPEKAEELMERLRGFKSLPGGVPEREFPVPGYQGFTIEGLDSLGYAGKEIHLMGRNIESEDGRFLAVGQDLDLEHWLLQTAGEALPPDSKEFALDLMAKSREPVPESESEVELEPEERSAVLTPPGPQDEIEVFPDLQEGERTLLPKESVFTEKRPRMFLKSPVFEPGKWNRAGAIKKNNCYNYGTNRMTYTYAQPGNQCGRPIRRFSCRSVREAVICDGLVPVKWSSYGLRGTSRPPETGSTPVAERSDVLYGHVAAVIVSPNYDYHWYRLDNANWWSHKSGFSRATDKDSKGRKIKDPKTCSRPYRDFCGYYFVPTHIKVKGELKELSQTR
ncbi:MAG: DUF4384 domain-containing protein [Thermodesulfobacteriota bacterium]